MPVDRVLTLGLLLLSLGWLSAASAYEYRFEAVTMADGLSQSAVRDMAQCRDGYLWVGTQYGLDRFDGYGFRSWRHQPDDPHSLSSSVINDLLLARDGKLWVATRNGLNRFDTRTGRAERFFSQRSPSPEWGGSEQVRIIAEASDGRLFLEIGADVAYWSPETREIHIIPWANALEPHRSGQRSALLDATERLWVHNETGLWRQSAQGSEMQLAISAEAQPERPLYRSLALTRQGHLALATDSALILINPHPVVEVMRFTLAELGYHEGRLNSVFSASDGALWLAMSTRLVRLWPEQRRWETQFDGSRIRTDADTRQRIDWREHPNGDIWMTSQYGIGRWQASSGRYQIFAHDPRDPLSIPPTTLGAGYVVFIDEEDSVWVGSRLGGLARKSALRARFEHIVDRSGPGELVMAGHNVVRGIAEQFLEGRKHLWLALDHAGVRQLERGEDGTYQIVAEYHSRADAGRQLPGNAVWGVQADPLTGLVWALEAGHLIGIDGSSGQIVERIRTEVDGEPMRNHTMTWSWDRSALLVGGSSRIVEYRLDADRRTVTPGWVYECPRSDRIINILPVDEHRLLVAARYGIGLVDRRADQPDHLMALEGRMDVFGLANHHQSGWWIGAREGGLGHVELIESGPEAGLQVHWYGREHGLVDDTIYAIIPQPDGQLWMSSNRGLMRWNPGTFDVRHFTPIDGIQSLEFNNTVAHVGVSGRYYFGGINGVNVFYPDEVADPSTPPRLHLEAVSVRGESAPRGFLNDPHLVLAYDQNDVELSFVGIKLSDPTRVRYSYRLEGLDREWIDAGPDRRVRYAGLGPGSYRFYARAANSDGIWTDNQLLLSFDIRSPPWATSWAYLAYALSMLLLAALIGLGQRRRRLLLEAQVRQRTAELMEQQALVKRQAEDLERALEARTLFLANISHEFRTPLTLIEASLQELETDGADSGVVDRGRRYLRQLLRMVDQLLDLSRLRFSADPQTGARWAVAPVVRFTVEAFRSLAAQRGIELETDIESGWSTRCNQSDVEKILLNLLTNAIKFTPSGGRVHVRLSGHGNQLQLAVSDTGPGIDPEEQKLVFERFHRVDASTRGDIAGAGIGLALVREAATAMGGSVELESALGQGSTFLVNLPGIIAAPERSGDRPLNLESLKLDAALLEPGPDAVSPLTPASNTGQSFGNLLIVEDNPDLRDHLKRLLEDQWRVMTASNGEEGLRLARRHGPDMVVSDIMMPGMDGFQMLKLLRQDVQTSHIPVLLLTARQDDQTRLKGLSLSADDFLAKPFDAEELRLRLRRMHHNRERLRRRLAGQAATDSASATAEQDADISPRDLSLLMAVNQWLERHCDDGDLKVERLAEDIAVERRTLQRKLKALTGLTPAAYIRHFSLQRAGRLLLETERSVQDIALSCGFANPQHFSRSFSRHYGMPPDQWRRERTGATSH